MLNAATHLWIVSLRCTSFAATFSPAPQPYVRTRQVRGSKRSSLAQACLPHTSRQQQVQGGARTTNIRNQIQEIARSGSFHRLPEHTLAMGSGVGQGLFFSTLGLQAVMTATGHWNLAEQGIIGTNVFVPWRQVSAWEWQDTKILAIALKPGLLRPRILRISVAPEGHDLVAAILANKIPA